MKRSREHSLKNAPNLPEVLASGAELKGTGYVAFNPFPESRVGRAAEPHASDSHDPSRRTCRTMPVGPFVMEERRQRVRYRNRRSSHAGGSHATSCELRAT